MASMTKEELKSLINEVTIPLIKQHCADGGEIANVVKQAVEKAATAPTEQPPWFKGLLDGGASKAATPKAREKGMAMGRYMWAMGHCKAVKGESPSQDNVFRVLREYGDGDLVDAAQKAIEERKAMTATSATAGGFLVPTQFSTDVVEYLRARTIIRSVNGGPRVVPMPMGTIKMPKIQSGTTAAYVGEASNATKTEAQTSQITMSFKKLAAIVPFSNDLLRYSSPQADGLIRDDVVRAIQVKEDAQFIRGNGSAAAPTGLRYQALPQNIIAANSTVSLANTVSDLGTLMAALLNNNIPMTRPAFYFAPRTYIYLTTVQNSNGFYVFRDEMLNSKTLWGFPFGYTTSIPINLTDQGGTTESEVYLVDLDDVMIGEAANLLIDVSPDAAYYDGTNVVSAFSQDTTVLRAIEEHDLAMRRQESIALLNGVKWQ